MIDSRIFMPGTQVKFEVPRTLDTKGQTFFRGYREDHYIILDYPCNDNRVPLPLKDKMKCIVRFLYQGKAYAFESEIQRTARYPYPFIFINYPDKLDNINLRNSERFSIRFPTFYNQEALEGALENYPSGMMLDLSEKGCLLETKQLLEQETLLFLAFNLPDQALIKNLVAKVKRISKKEEVYRLGMMFMVSEDPDIEKIRAYLSYMSAIQAQA